MEKLRNDPIKSKTMTEIIIIVMLILLNGMFSLSEISLVSARKSRLEAEAKKGSKSAKTALVLSNEPDKFLSTVQIGITLIGILTGLYSGKTFASGIAEIISKMAFLAPYSLTIATALIVLVVTYLTIVFGELVPKRLGLGMAERMAKLVARPMKLLSSLMSPVVWLLSKSTSFILTVLGVKDEDVKVTEDEIKILVREGLDSGEVQAVEHDIVERVFNLGDRDIESVMTHRNDLVWLDIKNDTAEIKEKVKESIHNIYPVISGRQEDVLGVVYLKDLFGQIDSPDFSLEALIHPAQYLPENKSAYSALEQFKKTNVKYGLVIDEFGEVNGIVTLADIMEALVGEVAEEGEEKDIVLREDGSFLVNGQCSFYNFLEYFDLEGLYAEHDHNTLGGLILEILEHLPKDGEKCSWHNFNFEIMDMDGTRIDKVLVTRSI